MPEKPGPLNDIRVLDLTTPLAEATGRVLADLGAEVIKVEPPGGCASRRVPPFVETSADDPERSLFWRAWGLGKFSVVLDLDSARDRERFLALVRGADVLVESFTPGTLGALGLGYADLERENPSLPAWPPRTLPSLSKSAGISANCARRSRPPVWYSTPIISNAPP